MEVKKTSLHTPDPEKKYELSALIDVDSFFYAIIESGGQVVEIDHIKLSKEVLLEKYPNLKTAKIAVANSSYTLIPAAEYNEQSKVDYIHQVTEPSMQNQYVYLADFVEKTGLYVCYAISKSVYQYCFGLPVIPVIRHQISTMLSQSNSGKLSSRIHVSRHQDYITITAHVDGQLRVANTFESKSPITTLYYITLVQKNLGVKKRDIEVEFSGAFTPGDETEKLVSRYYTNLSYKPYSLKMDGQLLEKSSYYFPLQSVSLCV